MVIIELRNLHLESGCEVLPGVVKLVGSMFDSDDDYDGEGDDIENANDDIGDVNGEDYKDDDEDGNGRKLRLRQQVRKDAITCMPG